MQFVLKSAVFEHAQHEKDFILRRRNMQFLLPSAGEMPIYLSYKIKDASRWDRFETKVQSTSGDLSLRQNPMDLSGSMGG